MFERSYLIRKQIMLQKVNFSSLLVKLIVVESSNLSKFTDKLNMEINPICIGTGDIGNMIT